MTLHHQNHTDRSHDTWLPPVGSAEALADHDADRYGFTHQEMLDNVNLIHMNGRVYDPTLGRFLSVDPVFEFPTNTQSLNPYSYVLNNPLSMTDPTGYTTECGKGNNQNSPCQPSTTMGTGTHIKGVQEATSIIAGNGSITRQGSADAQNQPTGHNNINSPSMVAKAAAASNCAYGDSSCKLPNGMHAASAGWLKQHRLNQSDLQDKKSGYSATIYIDSKTGIVFIAFRGTEPFKIKDDITDYHNAQGQVTQQYIKAAKLGGIVANNVSGVVVFTGHSLGGGLASVAALRASEPADTFNAAGVSQGVLHGLDLRSANASRLIQAYYVRGDPLTTLQTYTPLPSALGTPHPLTPTVMDILHQPINPIYLHEMPAVLDALPGGG